MNKPQNVSPFRTLGKRLKDVRIRANETLAEASGAVEIDVRQLASYELGQSRPTEDVLLLLISHFGIKDDEALTLWELAGYSMNRVPMAHMVSNELPQVSVQNQDERILFTDIVDVIVNKYGVVMNFMQNTGPASPPRVVSRVGMSREHAKSVLQILQVTLNQTELTSQKYISPDKKSDQN